MNEIINKFLLAGAKFMPETHLKQPGFTYSACDPYRSILEIQIIILKMNLIELVFSMIILFGKTKKLEKRAQSDNVLRDKAFKIAKNPKYDGYQRGSASMVYKFFDKKSSASGISNEPDCQLADEIHKPIIRKFFLKKEKFIHHLETTFGE